MDRRVGGAGRHGAYHGKHQAGGDWRSLTHPPTHPTHPRSSVPACLPACLPMAPPPQAVALDGLYYQEMEINQCDAKVTRLSDWTLPRFRQLIER